MEQTTASPANRIVLNVLLYASIVLLGFAIYGFKGLINEAANPQSPPVPTQPAWWKPSPGTSWQWQLSGKIDTSLDVQMYVIDLFDAPQEAINQLHEQGRRVICYFSAGTLEGGRPDKDTFPQEAVGKALPGRASEYWLDIRKISRLKPVMVARLELAAVKGCDGVVPGNVDGYANETGFPITDDDQLVYNNWLAEQAHKKGLSVGLRNDLEQVKDLLTHFDWALNEECFTHQECDLLSPFIDAGKAVFGVEYSLNPQDFCPQANEAGFDFLLKRVELNSWRQACQ